MCVRAIYSQSNVSRCEIYLRCPTEGGCGPIGLKTLFAESKVCQNDVPLWVQQDVLRLQVSGKQNIKKTVLNYPMCPPGGAKGSHFTCKRCAESGGSQEHLRFQQHRSELEAPGRPSPSGGGRRAAGDKDQSASRSKSLVRQRCRTATHLSAVHVVQNKVELVCGLEGVMKPHQEGMLDVLHEDAALGHDVLLLLKGRQHEWPLRLYRIKKKLCEEWILTSFFFRMIFFCSTFTA